jgi:hypothetical protein
MGNAFFFFNFILKISWIIAKKPDHRSFSWAKLKLFAEFQLLRITQKK